VALSRLVSKLRITGIAVASKEKTMIQVSSNLLWEVQKCPFRLLFTLPHKKYIPHTGRKEKIKTTL
jgi:hypothetical protein